MKIGWHAGISLEVEEACGVGSPAKSSGVTSCSLTPMLNLGLIANPRDGSKSARPILFTFRRQKYIASATMSYSLSLFLTTITINFIKFIILFI